MPGKSFDQVVKGYSENKFLVYPNINYSYIPNWNPEHVYNLIVETCFRVDPKERSSFTELKELIEALLKPHELENFKATMKQHAESNSIPKYEKETTIYNA